MYEYEDFLKQALILLFSITFIIIVSHRYLFILFTNEELQSSLFN